MQDFRVLIHGGAGVISNSDESVTKAYLAALQGHVVAIGNYASQASCNRPICALDIVEFAVRRLEDDPLFNAGMGSVLAADGTHELEASIMDGTSGEFGAASLLTHVKNPISLARVVLAHPQHCYLAGEGAEKLALANDLDWVDNSFFTTTRRREQLAAAQCQQKVVLDHSSAGKMGTVGCVCMFRGEVAAGTSTGGMTNKLNGRIGDSPIVGAGTYAEGKSCAVSCTGVGEEFMKRVAAYDVCARMRYGSAPLSQALRATIHEYMPSGSGGAIAVAANGEYAMEFNTVGMYRGVVSSDGSASVGIWTDEHAFSWNTES